MDLAKSAMLVSVTIVNGGLLGERRDKIATAQMERRFSLHERRGKASKFLIDRKHPKVKAVVAASQRVREVLYKYTMPWGDDKSRLLPVQVHEIFREKMADAEAELRETWEEFLQVYPALIAASERELGALFDASQYPSVTRSRELFSCKVTYWPIPSTKNFVAEIADDAVQQATRAMAVEIETRVKQAASTLVARAKETVSTFVDRLSSYKSKADGKIIRDSLTTNCREVGELISYMNITKNQDIDDMAVEMIRLSYYTASNYRNSDARRRDGIKQGKAILAKLVDLHSLDLEVSEMVAEAAEYEF